MQNPTKVKRPKRRLPSSTRPLHSLPVSDAHFNVPDDDDPPGSSIHARPRLAPPEVARGAVLVALVVVTIVLYITLWEVERLGSERFSSVPNPYAGQLLRVLHTSSSTWYPNAVAQGAPAFSSRPEPNPSGGRTALTPSQASRTTPNPWPAPILRIPGEHNINGHTESEQARPFNGAHCNGPCRFLLPVRIGEQESKARMHLTELLTLARRLNRTMVLPNVGKSRMSACSEWPFGAYYDTNGLALGDGSLAIDLERFTKWVDGRPTPPSCFGISMASIPRGRGNVDMPSSQTGQEGLPFIINMVEVDSKVSSCLESKLARLRSSLPETALSISFHPRSLKSESDTSADLVRFLSSNLPMDTGTDLELITGLGSEPPLTYLNASHLPLADTDVLVLDYALRHPLFVAAPAHRSVDLRYAPALYDLADRLSDNLGGSFVAVHWRMETVPVQNLAWCAASLVSTLHGLLQQQDKDEDDLTGSRVRARRVWLATDHPRPLGAFVRAVASSGGRPNLDDLDGSGGVRSLVLERYYGPSDKSSTFRAHSSEHDEAIGTLVEAFQPGGDLDVWELTGLSEQLRRYPYIEGRLADVIDESLLRDPGVFGILDKLVVMRAGGFVTGSTECSKTSSFSKQVIKARQDTFEAERGRGTIRSVVEYFGKW